MTRCWVFCIIAVSVLGKDAAYAQAQSQSKYFPLQVGDFWQYRVGQFHYSSSYFDTTIYGTISVVKDTVMNNGLTYAIVHNHNMAQMFLPLVFNNYPDKDWDEYLRIDTSNACVFGYGDSIDVLYDSLSASPGDQYFGTPGPNGYRYVEFNCRPEDTLSVPGGTLRTVKNFFISTLTVEAGGDYNMAYATGIGYVKGSYLANDMAETSWDDSIVYARINGVESGIPAGIDVRRGNPAEYLLRQKYPNPFNPTTNIEYRISNFGFVSLKVYDVLGRLVATLVNGVRSPGSYEVQFNGSKFASGVYFYRLTAPRAAAEKL